MKIGWADASCLLNEVSDRAWEGLKEAEKGRFKGGKGHKGTSLL